MKEITLYNFKKIMTEKAKKKGGVWENFGQKEMYALKKKYNYNPYGNETERKIASEIDNLNEWANNFTLLD